MNLKKQFMEGLLTQNPVLVQVLGMCSTMAITTSFFNGLGMGIAVLVILTLSNIIIAAINKAKTEEAMKAVVADPDNSTFSEALALSDEMTGAALAGGGTLTEAYEVQVGGAPAGHALKIVASGSQGNIEMMVGLDAEGAVTGVSIVDNAETAGIGSKVMENENGVLDQFIG